MPGSLPKFQLKMHRLLLVLAVLAIALQPGQAAAERALPADARLAAFAVIQHPEVTLDSAPFRLAPGAQVRDESNRIVLPTSLQGNYLVLYTTDSRGEIYRVWILSPEEAAQIKSRK